ncbi:hypothetical protein A4X09_0g5880 [Tilletia walkeri]|uniref:NADAR domain-containing protein n=1 Tax=Tilletia walkeri TaxID=117179 RepID=A0A8X7N665_9BASI|nr:hypothetical protein A4X09_0g5880 [Tilletia walkeri]
MEAIEVITNSEVSSERSITPTIDTDPLNDVTTPPTPAIYFGVETEPFFFLSSFFPSILSLGPHEFLTAEGFFQAAKFSEHPNLVLALKKTKSSKEMLYKLQHWTECIPEDWDEKRLPIMKEIQELKFAQHKQLRARLVQTGDAKLIYRSKTDSFFGCGQDNQGLNHLGRILMDLRSAFQACPEPESTLLMTCFELSLPHPSTHSTIWCSDNTSERWYPHTKSSLKEINIAPAISDSPASDSGFLHGIAHGDKPWTLEVLIQLREEVREGVDGPQVRVCYNHNYTARGRDSSVDVRLSSEHLKSSLMIDGGIYIYGFSLALNSYSVESHGCTVSIAMLPSKPAKRSGPEFELYFTLFE